MLSSFVKRASCASTRLPLRAWVAPWVCNAVQMAVFQGALLLPVLCGLLLWVLACRVQGTEGHKYSREKHLLGSSLRSERRSESCLKNASCVVWYIERTNVTHARHSNTHSHTLTHIATHTCTHTHTCAHTHAQICTHTHTRTRTRKLQLCKRRRSAMFVFHTTAQGKL